MYNVSIIRVSNSCVTISFFYYRFGTQPQG